MRKDMAKVIVERSRIGGSRDRKGRMPKDLDSLPRKQSMKKAHTDRKVLNENLKPLKNFLNSKIGQNWDKVFSEICENIKLDSAVQKHVRDHVFDLIQKDVRVENKKVYYSISRFYNGTVEIRDGELYIDPKTNIVRKYKRKKPPKDSRPLIQKELEIRFSYEKHRLDNGSKFVLENKTPYRLFFDKITQDHTIKHEATAKHAERDFQTISYRIREDDVEHMHKRISESSKQLDLKHPYFAKMLELMAAEIKKHKKELEGKKLEGFKTGEKVEISKDDGKTFVEGVVNRVEYGYRSTSPVSYWVTVDTKNVYLPIAYGLGGYRIRSVEPKPKKETV